MSLLNIILAVILFVNLSHPKNPFWKKWQIGFCTSVLNKPGSTAWKRLAYQFSNWPAVKDVHSVLFWGQTVLGCDLKTSLKHVLLEFKVGKMMERIYVTPFYYKKTKLLLSNQIFGSTLSCFFKYFNYNDVQKSCNEKI